MKKKNDTDEITLESWKAECKQMEEEMAHDSAELRAIMEEAKKDTSLDPEMRKIILETGDKLLGADGWLKDVYSFTTNVIAHCDEMENRVKSLDRKRRTVGRAPRARRHSSASPSTFTSSHV